MLTNAEAGASCGLIDRYGQDERSVVILVHGAVVNRATMAPLARALAGRARVWIPDLPGHGSRRDEVFDWEVALGLLAALVAEAEAPVVVAGDSLGGYLALALAARHGSPIAGVVAGGCTFPMRGAAAVGAALSDGPVAVLTALVGERAMARAMLGTFVALGGDCRVAEETAAHGIRLASRSESIAALRRFDLSATIECIDCPIVFVNGGKDVPIVWLAERYARLARRGRAVRISASFHGVMTFRPALVAREIESLLDTMAPEV